MSKLHFIKAPASSGLHPVSCFADSSVQIEFEHTPDFVKKSYDYAIDPKLFCSTEKSICTGYNLLYKYITSYTNKNPDTKIITIGGDHSISMSTIAAMNEKYIVQNGDVCKSKLKILYIDLYTDMYTSNDGHISNDPSKMVSSSLFGLNNPSLINHKLLLDTDQILYIGLVDEEDMDMDMGMHIASDYNLNYITLKKIKQIGINKVIDIIKNLFGDDPIHISLDMKVFKKDNTENKLELNDILELFNNVKDQVVSCDITEFNPYITKDSIHKCLITLFDIKEKNLNIFNEFSEFIIFRPATQIDNICDYGWYIMRGMLLKDREQLLKKIPDGKMLSINLNNEEYYIAKTNMNEQNNKSIFLTNKIEDFVLFSDEKKDMCFELLNTNNINTNNINTNNTDTTDLTDTIDTDIIDTSDSDTSDIFDSDTDNNIYEELGVVFL